MTDDNFEIGKVLTITDITLFVEKQKSLESIASTAIYQAETSELSFLQAQIKPHFLNNTLSVIGSMITRSPQEAEALIAELGEYLANCYYFDSTSPMALLEKESLTGRKTDSGLRSRMMGPAQVSGKYMNPLQALEEAAALAPQVAFIDIEMPELDGLTFAERLL